jgi:8-oxo-dGTP diphosphatase
MGMNLLLRFGRSLRTRRPPRDRLPFLGRFLFYRGRHRPYLARDHRLGNPTTKGAAVPRPTTPLIAADILIRLREQPDKLVLIERRHPPLGLAIPGGFVDVGERVETAAVREAREETSLEVELECLLGLYSDPQRDPRGHTVTAVYIARASGEPRAADDAKSILLADPADRSLELVFDHRLVLDDYLRWLQDGHPAPLRF